MREKTLWWMAFMGGALGMIAAQYLLDHKSNKLWFMLPSDLNVIELDRRIIFSS